MLRVNQIKIKINENNNDILLKRKIADKLNISIDRILNYEIVRKSVDARKNELKYVYSIDVSISNESNYRIKDKDISVINNKKYKFPYHNNSSKERPVIIGLGPAGLFCGYILAQNGYKPIIIERGKNIDQRSLDVQEFWKNGKLLKNSNVQFGEGGAGAFSDGKLNTLVKDKSGRNKAVLEILKQFGAPEQIVYDNKPHIGTDLLVDVVKNIRNAIIELGGEVIYESTVDKFEIDNNRICAVYSNNKRYDCKHVVVAIGHSARDTFEILNKSNIKMEPKAFAVGFRVMHPQNIIDINQYGEENLKYNLPVASYKVTANLDRGIYSFCMCPGGYVVNASSEEGKLVVNGMSYHNRDSKVANSAIVVQVTPEDFEDKSVLGGVEFQRKIEAKAYEIAGGKIPIQKYGDFKKKNNSDVCGEAFLEFEPKCKGEFAYSDLSLILPKEINDNFIEGMEHFGNIIKHFNDNNVIMAGIESRTSSPVRICRDDTGQSNCKGLYPCGEGAGYAGGIVSAAMDGLYIAECVAKNINEE